VADTEFWNREGVRVGVESVETGEGYAFSLKNFLILCKNNAFCTKFSFFYRCI